MMHLQTEGEFLWFKVPCKTALQQPKSSSPNGESDKELKRMKCQLATVTVSSEEEKEEGDNDNK